MRAGTSVVALLAAIILTAAGCNIEKKASANSLTFWTAEDNPEG